MGDTVRFSGAGGQGGNGTQNIQCFDPFDKLRAGFAQDRHRTLNVSGPKGDTLGYAVLLREQDSPVLTITSEREFVPGFGMVREVDITAFNGSLVSRQELTIKKEANLTQRE